MGYITDISEFQSDVDFEKLSKIADFVILRTQCGSLHLDKNYSKNVQGCKANNLPFGSYAYFKAVSISDAEQEAKDFLSRIDKASKFLVLDVEEVTVYAGADLLSSIQRFIDICIQAGYKTGLYTGECFFGDYGLSSIVCDFLWIAKYSTTKPSVDFHLWQFSDKGIVDGIPTAVDMNQLGSKPLSFFIGEPQPQPSNVPLYTKVIMNVKALSPSDIRSQPSHTAGYVGDIVVGKSYQVYAHTGDWHCISPDGKQWVDGNNGKNLYWTDNPNLSQPQPIYHTCVAGDTVGKLAQANGVTIDQIKVWNNLDSSYTIYAGKKIRVK